MRPNTTDIVGQNDNVGGITFRTNPALEQSYKMKYNWIYFDSKYSAIFIDMLNTVFCSLMTFYFCDN